MAVWRWVLLSHQNDEGKYSAIDQGEKSKLTKISLLPTLFTERIIIIITIQIKRLLAEPPRSSSSIIKDFAPSPQTSFVPILLVFYYFPTRTKRLTKIVSNLAPLWGIDHRSWTMEWHTTLSSNRTKNNKQEELATRSWKHRPHIQLCLWSFPFLFNTDVVLFLAYDLHAIPCRWWRSEDHCCGVCSLDMKKETVNEWNKMSTPFRVLKNKSKQARYWILLGFMCVRELN